MTYHNFYLLDYPRGRCIASILSSGMYSVYFVIFFYMSYKYNVPLDEAHALFDDDKFDFDVIGSIWAYSWVGL